MPEQRPKADASFGDLEAVWWQVGGILKESYLEYKAMRGALTGAMEAEGTESEIHLLHA